MSLKQSRILVPILGMFFLFPFFFFGGPTHYAPRSLLETWNLGHLLFFMLFVCLLDEKRDEGFSWCWVLIVFVASLGLGILIEFIQSGVNGRQPSTYDIVCDGLGAILGVLWVCWRDSSRKRRGVLLFIAVLISVWVLSPVATALVDEWQARKDFPLLADFENPNELSRWSGSASYQQSQEQVTHGKFSLKISLTTATYSGVSLHYFPHDWRGLSRLHFSVFNNSVNDLSLTVRAHDKKHEQGPQHYRDRFNRSFTLHQGWNDINIPLADIENSPKGRRMDMANIRSLGLFVIRQLKNKSIYVDNMRLVP